jgi:hypothetical protein
MKDEHDKKTGDLLLSANARRQAAYAERQRAQGRKKFSYWMRPEEAEQVAAFLEQLRKRSTTELYSGVERA